MQVIPAIDVLDGSVVRLRQGDYGDCIDYDKDPEVLAENYARAGAQLIHFVNLRSAESGELSNATCGLIRRLAQKGIRVQVAGGIRSLSDARKILAAEAARIVFGTAVIVSPDVVQSAVALFGPEKCIAALDCKNSVVRIRGWKESGEMDIQQAVRFAMELGIRTILVTDITRDGMEAGPSIALYVSLVQLFPEILILI